MFIVFDVGCTLVHPDPEVLRRIIGADASTVSDEDLSTAFKYACAANLHRLPHSPAGTRQGQVLLRSLGIESSPERAAAVWDEVLARGGATRELYSRRDPEAIELLTQLSEAGHVLVAASNNDGTLDDELRYFGLDGFFWMTVDSAHLGVEKPAGQFYAAVLELRTPPDREMTTVHIGDDPIRDVAAPLLYGFNHAVLYDPDDAYLGLRGEHQIRRLTDVMPQLVAEGSS